MKQELKNEMFDAMLRSAFQDYAKAAKPELETREELRARGVELHAFSPEFEGKMKKLIRKTKRKAWWRDHRKRIQHTAAMFVALIAAGGVLVTQVDAVRIPVVNFVISVSEKFSEIQIGSSGENSALSEKFQDYLPTYMPEGFVVESVEETENTFSVLYTNESGGQYSIDFYVSAAGGAIDTEEATVMEEKIHGYSALMIQKEDQIMVFWYPSGHEYIIAGTISKEDILSILNSIEKTF